MIADHEWKPLHAAGIENLALFVRREGSLDTGHGVGPHKRFLLMILPFLNWAHPVARSL